MRADARKNRDHLLAVAGGVITEQGAEASLRDIARRADVGLATLLRHFPTREALLDALLRTSFDELTAQADVLETSSAPDDALVLWLRDFVACAHNYRGAVASMMTAIEDPESALHASCVTMRGAGDATPHPRPDRRPGADRHRRRRPVRTGRVARVAQRPAFVRATRRPSLRRRRRRDPDAGTPPSGQQLKSFPPQPWQAIIDRRSAIRRVRRPRCGRCPSWR